MPPPPEPSSASKPPRLLAPASERNAELDSFLAKHQISPATSFSMLKLTREQANSVMAGVSEHLAALGGERRSEREAEEAVLQRLKHLGVRTGTAGGGSWTSTERQASPGAARDSGNRRERDGHESPPLAEGGGAVSLSVPALPSLDAVLGPGLATPLPDITFGRGGSDRGKHAKGGANAKNGRAASVARLASIAKRRQRSGSRPSPEKVRAGSAGSDSPTAHPAAGDVGRSLASMKDFARKNGVDLSTSAGFAQVFVKNLDKNTGEKELRSLFSKHGAVGGIEIPRDKETGLGKGFAFVRMRSTDADSCIKALLYTKPFGRALIVERCRGAGEEDVQADRGDHPAAGTCSPAKKGERSRSRDATADAANGADAEKADGDPAAAERKGRSSKKVKKKPSGSRKPARSSSHSEARGSSSRNKNSDGGGSDATDSSDSSSSRWSRYTITKSKARARSRSKRKRRGRSESRSVSSSDSSRSWCSEDGAAERGAPMLYNVPPMDGMGMVWPPGAPPPFQGMLPPPWAVPPWGLPPAMLDDGGFPVYDREAAERQLRQAERRSKRDELKRRDGSNREVWDDHPARLAAQKKQSSSPERSPSRIPQRVRSESVSSDAPASQRRSSSRKKRRRRRRRTSSSQRSSPRGGRRPRAVGPSGCNGVVPPLHMPLMRGPPLGWPGPPVMRPPALPPPRIVRPCAEPEPPPASLPKATADSGAAKEAPQQVDSDDSDVDMEKVREDINFADI